MVKAYIQISAEPGKTRNVLNASLQIPGVVEGHIILGPFDIMLEIEQDTVSALMKTVEQKIHLIPGIRSTSTVICFESGM
ncbi:MAG: Lrp/AsnC family transcriptional regulator [Candidatus Hodarchaeota archaeon]